MKTVLMPSRPVAPAQFKPPTHKQAAASEKQVLADMALGELGHTPLIPAQMQAFSTTGPELTPGRLGWCNGRNDRQDCFDSSVSKPIRLRKRIKHRDRTPGGSHPTPARQSPIQAGLPDWLRARTPAVRSADVPVRSCSGNETRRRKSRAEPQLFFSHKAKICGFKRR